MNRRSFLLTLGAAACGGNKVGKRPRDPQKAPTKAPATCGIPVFNFYQSQTRRSPLAFHGSTLVHSNGRDLWILDALTLKRIGGYALSHLHFCFVQDGTLVVVGLPPESLTCLIHRIDRNGIRETLTGPVLGSRRVPTHVLAGASADEIYVTGATTIDLLRFRKGQVELGAHFRIPFPGSSTRGQLFSQGDGRLIYAADGLNVLQAGREPVRFDMSGRMPLHLVPATRERLWYSDQIKEPLIANDLVLTAIATPTVDEQRIDVGPERIVHLASNGGAVAALLFSMHEGPTPIEPVLRWTVVVIDENGKERWRASVPSLFTPTFLLLNQVGFLAMSEHRVVLLGEKAAMLAWDAATGAAISVEPPGD